MHAGHLDVVALAAKAPSPGLEGQPVAELGLRLPDSRPNIEAPGLARLVANPVAVRERLERKEKALRLDRRLKVRNAKLIVDDRGVPHEVQLAVEIGVDAEGVHR